ncbi:MAG: BNR-4 repeat-containing protein [Verrucomicrobiota bacterium]
MKKKNAFQSFDSNVAKFASMGIGPVIRWAFARASGHVVLSNFRSFLMILLCAIGGWSAPVSAAPAVLAPDGAWCWFGNPRSLFKGGILYSSYVRNADGRTALSAYDPKTGESTVLWTSSFVAHDDHNNAALLDLSDGRLLAIYAKHHSEKQFYYRLSLNANPVTAADWGPERIYTNTTEPVTYANPYQLRSESGRVYNFTRNLNFNPTYLTSDNSGEKWSEPKIFIKVGTGVRPYVQYCSDYDKRIDFLYTDGHPDSVKTSLFHAYYENGGYYRTDGKFLRKLQDAPLLHDAPHNERGSAIYEYSEKPTTDYNDHIPFGRAWCWDIAYDKNKAPVVVFSVNHYKPDKLLNWDDRRLQYYYARWNGSSWTKRLIAQAGAPLYKDAYDYAGGITVDPSNPDVVYFSSNAADPFDLKDVSNVALRPNKRYEIYRGVTKDGGLSFAWEPVTKDSAADNLRPYVPRGNKYPYGVVWFAGSYASYGSWNTAMMGIFDKELVSFSTLPPQASVKKTTAGPGSHQEKSTR